MKKRKYKYSSYKQGTYKPVNREKYIGRRSPEYRSSWELKFFQWCDRNVNILEWASESTIVPYKSPIDKRMHRYFVDGTIALREGDSIKRYLVEIKPFKQTQPPVSSSKKKKSTIIYENVTYAVNTAKWKAAKTYAEKRNMEFIILTENELNVR